MTQERLPSSDEAKGQFLVYAAEDGRIKLDVRLADETVWLTQQQLAELFQTTVPNVSMHIRNVYENGERILGIRTSTGPSPVRMFRSGS